MMTKFEKENEKMNLIGGIKHRNVNLIINMKEKTKLNFDRNRLSLILNSRVKVRNHVKIK